jgi:hypothetical protein
VKRRGWWILAGGVLAAAAALALFRPRPSEKFPLLERVPADAVFYAGFPDYRELEAIQTPWTEQIRHRLDPARSHLAGGLAVYLDREWQWVALAQLTRSSALLAGSEVEDGAAVAAQTPEALARHRTRRGSLGELPEFRSLGSRFFINVEALKAGGRIRDFSAVGFEIRSSSPLILSGRALYHGGLFKSHLDSYAGAPRHGVPAGKALLQAALTEHFPRVWDEITHALDPLDREKVDREVQALGRDLLGGRTFRDFLASFGPGWGFALVPTPYARPALVIWIDFPDEATRDLVAKMVHRAVSDSIQLRRDRGSAPAFEVAAEGSIWRVKVADARAVRLGEACTPAYTFEKKRFVFSTCAATLAAPFVPAGEAHDAATAELPALLEAVRSLAPLFADDAFRGEAERKAALLSLRMFTPGAMTALRKQFPDPADLSKYLEAQKAQFEARALEEISKTLPYREELDRVNASIQAWEDRWGWLARVSWTGRFTPDSLVFELHACPTASLPPTDNR